MRLPFLFELHMDCLRNWLLCEVPPLILSKDALAPRQEEWVVAISNLILNVFNTRAANNFHVDSSAFGVRVNVVEFA